MQLYLLLTDRGKLDGHGVTNGRFVVTKKQLLILRVEGEHQNTRPVLSESRFPLIQVGRIPWETVLKRKELKRTIRPLGRTSSKHEHTPSP